MADHAEEELLDYEEEEAQEAQVAEPAKAAQEKKGYVGIHASGFKDFMLKDELIRAITDCGFEHPSEVQHECIPQAVLSHDILCQAKSGMGKTAVFVLSILQQIEAEADPKEAKVKAVVLCHTRELAFQITKEFDRFAKFIVALKDKVMPVYGGVPITNDIKRIKENPPYIVVGTPGRVKDLAERKNLNLSNVRHFVLDECDKMLEKLDMRADLQAIFKMTPHDKQVMMFSATLGQDIRPVCKKFMSDPTEIYVDDEGKLTLHGLVQHYVMLHEEEKNRKLTDLLDALEFNQVVIFVKNVARAKALNALLKTCNFPSLCLHAAMKQDERIKVYNDFKQNRARIMVATDLVGRGIDIERVNIVINYDMPQSDEKHGNGADTYLHRVGRAGRFGTKGLAITFVASAEDSAVLNQVQERFDVDIKELPDKVEPATYMTAQ